MAIPTPVVPSKLDAGVDDKLDFSQCRIPSRDEYIGSLHEIYNLVSRGLGRRIDKRQEETSVAIIGGSSGTGKSTLIKQFHDELREKSQAPGDPCMPFFIEGKFDELVGADPFSAIVQAFSSFAEDLKQSKTQELQRIRSCIQKQLGAEAALLTSVVPLLKDVIDWMDESVTKGSKGNAMNRLIYIFQTFVAAISTAKRPVIMFLDDLQWCDLASLDLILALLTDLDLRYFMFIGAYQSDEVEPDADLLRCFEVVSTIQPMARIEVTNLLKDKLNLLLLHALHREDEGEVMQLTDVIYKKTLGNIFHSIQILEELQRKERLTFSHATSQWEWDLDDVAFGKVLSDNVVEAVMGKISNTHPDLQRALVLAAYTRSGIDVDTLCQLTVVNGRFIPPDELLPMLGAAVADGLLVSAVGSCAYSFAHDRIQEAGEYEVSACTRRVSIFQLTDCMDGTRSLPAYWMIPEGQERDDLQLVRLGLKLYNMGIQGSGEDWILFSAADHLNAASPQLDSDDPTFLIKLNLQVAERASSVAAYQSATKYLGIARQSLSKMKNPWEKYYDIRLRVYQGTVEAEMCLGNFEVGMAAGQTLLSRARSLEDKVPTYLAICHAFGQREQHKEAYDISIDVLCMMGAIPTGGIRVKIRLFKDIVYAKRFFARHSDAEILAIPILKDKRLELIMDLWWVAGTHAYYCGATLDFLVLMLPGLVITLTKGPSPLSGVSLTGYCLICSGLEDIKGAHRFSHLAREILAMTKAREQTCVQLYIAVGFIHAWQDQPSQVIDLYESAYKVGTEVGDFENALLSQVTGYQYAFTTGHSLADLELKYLSVMKKLRLYNIKLVYRLAEEQLLSIQYLRGTGGQSHQKKPVS